jgi:hypothetical protein
MKRVVLRADDKGRLSISALDANNNGHGHRFTGPKYTNDASTGTKTRVTIEHTIDHEDACALREYVTHFEEAAGEIPSYITELTRTFNFWKRALHHACSPSAHPSLKIREQTVRAELVQTLKSVAAELESEPQRPRIDYDILAWDVSDAIAKTDDDHQLDLSMDAIKAELPEFIRRCQERGNR